jgi:hypothetical protein
VIFIADGRIISSYKKRHTNRELMMSYSGHASAVAMPRQLEADRLRKLFDELSFALSRADATTLRAWGGRSAARLPALAGKRIGALASLALRFGRATVSEVKNLGLAAQNRRLGEHVGDRTAATIDGTIGLAQSASALTKSIGQALKSDPKTNAPPVLAAFLGFYAGSGGVDGDGGIPDLDLLAGIDAHRSILTHSILAGGIAEGLLLSITDLASQINARLPVEHDTLWDKLAEAATPLTQNLTAGASAGIAYHLLVDATIQPAAYHGLPFEMSMEAHQTVMGANGAAEAAYVARQRTHQPAVIDQATESVEPTPGWRFVNAVSDAAKHASQTGKAWFSNFKKS